jgi:hypothetical protein
MRSVLTTSRYPSSAFMAGSSVRRMPSAPAAARSTGGAAPSEGPSNPARYLATGATAFSERASYVMRVFEPRANDPSPSTTFDGRGTIANLSGGGAGTAGAGAADAGAAGAFATGAAAAGACTVGQGWPPPQPVSATRRRESEPRFMTAPSIARPTRGRFSSPAGSSPSR